MANDQCKLRRAANWRVAAVTCHLSLAIFHFSLCCSSIVAAEPEFPPEQIVFFEKHVRPVLAAQCWNCHAEKKAESGLRLDSREAVLKGGDRGEVVQPRDAAASLLIHAVKRDGELQMPPNGRLAPEQVAALTKWIDLGLPWPRESSGSALSQAWRTHWAFQPVTKPSVPHIVEDSWSQTPIDRFVLERLSLANGGRESPDSSHENALSAKPPEPGDSRPPLAIRNCSSTNRSIGVCDHESSTR